MRWRRCWLAVLICLYRCCWQAGGQVIAAPGRLLSASTMPCHSCPPAMRGCTGCRWCCCAGTTRQWPCLARYARQLQPAGRKEGPKRRSIEQQMGTAGSGERRLKTQGWDGVSSSVQRPHLRAACCGSRSRARCRRRPPTFAAPSAAELPPPGSPAAVPRAGAGADESAAQHEHWALQHHAPNQSVVPPEKPAAVQAVPTWRCPVAWEREKPSRSGGAPRRRTHQVRSSRAWREGQKRGAIHGNSEGWCIRA